MASSKSHQDLPVVDLLGAADNPLEVEHERGNAACHHSASNFTSHDGNQWPYFSRYRELDPDKQEIRILTLHAGPRETEISCSLQHGSFSEVEPFAALSYCWGAPGETSQIMINNEPVHIRQNLWSFLWYLRRLKGKTRLWVDFICINQRDPKERNHQVKLMASIFSTATRVYAWLGESTPQSDKAVAFINQGRIEVSSREEDIAARRRRKSGLRTLNAIFDRKYWTRLWIIQELALAREVHFMIGQSTIPWERLKSVYRRPLAPSGLRLSGKKTFVAMLNVDPESEPLLHELVSQFHHAECEDPRDRIYGLLGMTSPAIRERVLVEYNASILKVCLDNIKVLLPAGRPELEDAMHQILLVYGGEHRCSKELQDIADSKELRSELPSTVEVSLDLLDVWHGTCHTIAARKGSESEFIPLTEVNEVDEFDFYISCVRRTTSYAIDARVFLLHTSVRLQEGDCVMTHHFQFASKFKSVVLVVRKHEGLHYVVDLGVAQNSWMTSWLSGPDPEEWMENQIPDGQVKCALFTVPLAPIFASDFTYSFEISGKSFAEMLRKWMLPRTLFENMNSFMITWDPSCLLDGPSWAIEPGVFAVSNEDVLARGSTNTSQMYNLGKFLARLEDLQFKASLPCITTSSQEDL